MITDIGKAFACWGLAALSPISRQAALHFGPKWVSAGHKLDGPFSAVDLAASFGFVLFFAAGCYFAGRNAPRDQTERR